MAYGTKEFNQMWAKAMADSAPLTEAQEKELEKRTGGLMVNFVRAKPIGKEKKQVATTKSGEEKTSENQEE